MECTGIKYDETIQKVDYYSYGVKLFSIVLDRTKEEAREFVEQQIYCFTVGKDIVIHAEV